MRKLGMAGVMAAAALFAQTARADDAAKERREAADATSAEMKQEGREAKQETREAWDKTKAESREAKTDAQREMEQRDAATAQTPEGTASGRPRTAQTEKKHPLFDGKSNFDVEGKIQKVSKNSITLSREELPPATLNVSKDTKIELDGEQASMTQLKQGQDVKASFNLKGEKAEAVEIKAEKLDTQK